MEIVGQIEREKAKANLVFEERKEKKVVVVKKKEQEKPLQRNFIFKGTSREVSSRICTPRTQTPPIGHYTPNYFVSKTNHQARLEFQPLRQEVKPNT